MAHYSIKTIPEDFRVLEIPHFPEFAEKDTSRYTCLWMTKKSLTTFDALDIITKLLSVPNGAVCAEGLKDENAITEQLISIEKILDDDDLASLNNKIDLGDNKLRLSRIMGYSIEPVSARKLHGNIFTITIRDLLQDHARQIKGFVESKRFITLLNYYDKQRFGMDIGPYNTHEIGKAIINRDWITAFEELLKTKNIPEDLKPSIIGERDQNNCKEFFSLLNHQKLNFFVASYTSQLWNKKACNILLSLNKGRNAQFAHVGELFIPDEMNFQTFTSCTVDGYEFDKELFSAIEKPYERDLIFKTIFYPSDVNQDEINNKHRITINFFLPSGSYATMAIRQLFIRATNIYEE